MRTSDHWTPALDATRGASVAPGVVAPVVGSSDRATTTARDRMISAWHLRSLLTLLVHDARRTVTITELVRAVRALGFELDGRDSKVVSDSLRSPVDRGWVLRVGRGQYAPGAMAKVTRSRHRTRVREAYRRAGAVIDRG